jgi:hypothetical protein
LSVSVKSCFAAFIFSCQPCFFCFLFFFFLSWLLFVFSFLVVAESVGVGVFLQKIWGLLVGHAVLIRDGGGGLW